MSNPDDDMEALETEVYNLVVHTKDRPLTEEEEEKVMAWCVAQAVVILTDAGADPEVAFDTAERLVSTGGVTITAKANGELKVTLGGDSDAAPDADPV